MNDQATSIVFYCRDCQKLIAAEKIGDKYNYRCLECKGENVSFGSRKSVSNFYNIKNK